MTITRVSSREFGINPSRAKKASKRGPVFITLHGRPSHVLLTIKDYERIVAGKWNIGDMLAMPEAETIEFEPPRMLDNVHQPPDLS